MKTIFKAMLTTLTVILLTLTAWAQTAKLPVDTCQNTFSLSISEEGENGETPVIRTKQNEFNIIVDPQLRPVNFISTVEKYYRWQAQLDTNVTAYLIPDWKKLSNAEKPAAIKKYRADNEAKANATHNANNINHHLIYMVNNTSNDVALQMQDIYFIGVLEARIGKNNWRSVQHLTFSKCGNSYKLKHIAAGAKAYFIAPLLTGNYKTTLRYKVLGKDKFYYSNEFEGYINYCDLYDTKYSAKQKLEAFTVYSRGL